MLLVENLIRVTILRIQLKSAMLSVSQIQVKCGVLEKIKNSDGPQN